MIYTGESLAILKTLPARSARCCVTSPPYWGLRDYGHDQQIGLEDTPEVYVARLVAVFAEVRRVLSDDGTLWLNIGDSYAGSIQTGGLTPSWGCTRVDISKTHAPKRKTPATLKPKDMVGIPWMLAFALRSDGWYLRSDIIWHKPNPMPESVRDRPTKAHEYVFLLSKNRRYYWDQDAVREPDSGLPAGNKDGFKSYQGAAEWQAKSGGLGTAEPWQPGKGRNIRSVWTIPTQSFPGSHFAVMPPRLADRCIRAGSAIGDVVLDPFSGAGTTGLVARRLQRRYVGVELNPEFAELGRRRIESDAPLFNRARGS